jgi:hypothetical protein
MSDTTNINDLYTDPAGATSNNINLNAKEKPPTPDFSNSNMPSSQPSTEKSPGINLDESTIHQIVSGLQHASNSGATKLPSRDIPMNTSNIMNDPYTQQDYLPPSQNNYIPSVTNDVILEDYNKNKNRTDNLDDIYNELQIPLLLAIIYFIFQLPFLKKFLFSNMPFLFNVDGNLNLKGLVFKSVLFGIVYYGLNKTNKTFSKF